MDNSFVIKGNIVYTRSPDKFECAPGSFLVCVNGRTEGVFEEGKLPQEYRKLPVTDYKDLLIIPGMTDLHIHAPQYAFRGLGMDLELLDWLNMHAFTEEIKFCDMDYARRAYDIFAEDLSNSFTTRAVVFATVHNSATEYLMDRLDKTGLVTYVGKVNQDRNSAEGLCEKSAEASLEATADWIRNTSGRYENTRPIITPRFVPSCSDELLKGLGKLALANELPVQSHLSENPSEIDWVRQLCPWAENYGDVYDSLGLYDSPAGTVMAHCVYSTDKEMSRMKEKNVFIAHCPQSNENVSSGIAPVRKYMEAGVNIGLGTDIAAGASISLLRSIVDAISESKLRWRIQDSSQKPLSVSEAFYMATKGGGAFFGKTDMNGQTDRNGKFYRTGSFEKGFSFDALVIDDSMYRTTLALSLQERLERYIFLSGGKDIPAAKYVAGSKL